METIRYYLYFLCCEEIVSLDEAGIKARCNCGESGGAFLRDTDDEFCDFWLWGDAVPIHFDDGIKNYSQKARDGESPLFSPRFTNPSYRVNCWIVTEKSVPGLVWRYEDEAEFDLTAEDDGFIEPDDPDDGSDESPSLDG